MPQLRLIDGSAWSSLDGALLTPTNSGASSGTRLTAATANVWTIRRADANTLPPGSTSTGYFESALNTLATLQVDPSGTGLAGSPPTGNSTDYWLDFWLMGVWDGTSQLPVLQSDFLILASTGSYVHCKLCCNGSNGPPIFNPPGWALVSGNSVATAPRALYLRGDITESVSGTWGEWNRITIHLKYGAAGLVEIYQNGVLVSSTVSDTTPINWAAQALDIKLPAWSGVRWRVCGPISSWSGTDLPMRPAYQLDELRASLVTRMMLPFNTVATGAPTQGAFFQSSGSGTAAADATEYGTIGVAPYRRRLVFSGNGSSPVALTIDEGGPPPYNEQGWAHVVFSDVYVPTGTSLFLEVFQAGTSNNLARLQVVGGSIYYRYTTGPTLNLAPWATTVRYCVILHFNRDGRARFTLIDLTSAITASNKTVWSGPLADWEPQDFGAIRLSASTTSANIETGYVAICRRPTLSTIDSLATTSYTTVTPAIVTSGGVARQFPFGEERTTLPGGWYPLKHLGLERRVVIAPLGRAGLTRRDWTQSVLAGLTHTCGVEILAFDAGSINDILAIGSGEAPPTLNQILQNLKALLALCVANDNRVWISTMLPRTRSAAITAASNSSPIVLTVPNHGVAGSSARVVVSGVQGNTAANGTFSSVTINDANTMTLVGTTGNGAYTSGGLVRGYTDAELVGINVLNEQVRALAAAKQSNGLIALSDIALDAAQNPALYPNSGGSTGFWQDFTHPLSGLSPKGAGVIAESMLRTRVIPSAVPKPRRWSTAR